MVKRVGGWAGVRLLGGLLIGACAISVTALAGPLDLRKEMPPVVFDAAGLDKLNGAELEALQRWLEAREKGDSAVADESGTLPSAAVAQAPKSTGFGKEQLAPVPEPAGSRISARIKGDFTGWSGHSLFRLDNGQIWRQRIGGRYKFRAKSPEVEIFKGRFGYYMKLLASGRQVAVKRVK